MMLNKCFDNAAVYIASLSSHPRFDIDKSHETVNSASLGSIIAQTAINRLITISHSRFRTEFHLTETYRTVWISTKDHSVAKFIIECTPAAEITHCDRADRNVIADSWDYEINSLRILQKMMDCEPSILS